MIPIIPGKLYRIQTSYGEDFTKGKEAFSYFYFARYTKYGLGYQVEVETSNHATVLAIEAPIDMTYGSIPLYHLLVFKALHKNKLIYVKVEDVVQQW